MSADPTTPLQTLRRQRGWSQEELAQIAGVSTRTIQRLESGTPPSLETARALSAAFDLEPREVFPSREDPPPRNRRGAARGLRWGIGGALLGYASAFAAVTYTFAAGHTSGWHAGVTLGTLGAFTGIFCGGISRFARREINPADSWD